MSVTKPEAAATRLEVAAARAQFMATLHEVHDRLQPRALARERVDRLRVRGEEIAEDAMDAARERPAAAGAIGASLVLFLLRRPIGRLARRLFFKRRETDPSADRLH